MEKNLRLNDLTFYFGGIRGDDDGFQPEKRTCQLCGSNFNTHGLTVYIDAREDEKGNIVTHEGGIGPLCGKCLTAEPKELARIARKRAPIVRRSRPLRYDDETWGPKQRAERLLEFADLFDSISGLDAFLWGAAAVGVGQEYGRKDRAGKAA